MNKEETLRWLWAALTVLGALGLVVGLAAIVLMFVMPADNGDTWGVVLGGVGITSVLLSLGLVWAGISGRGRTPSPQVHSRWAWLILLALALLLFALALLVPAVQHTQAIFAPLHQGVILLPALALFFLVTRSAGREAAPTLRQTLLALTGGAVSVAVALPLEVIGFVLAVLATALIAAVFPGGQEELTRLFELVQGWSAQPSVDPEELINLAASPVVLLGAALCLAVAAPVVEEFCKTWVLSLMGVWEKPGLARCFTWGAACGLGFAIVEGITNGAMGLGDTVGWAGGVGARVLATAMHALSSGILGLGWGLFWRKRWWALPLAYILAVVYHGLWNLDVVLLIGGAGIGATVNQAGYLLCVLAALIHLFLLLLLPTGLFGIPMWLRLRPDWGGARKPAPGVPAMTATVVVQEPMPAFVPAQPRDTVIAPEMRPGIPDSRTVPLESPYASPPTMPTEVSESEMPSDQASQELRHESAEDAPTQLMDDWH